MFSLLIGCGAPEVVSKKIGIDGGALQLSRCLIEFPIKALKKETNIKVESFQPRPGALLVCKVGLTIYLDTL